MSTTAPTDPATPTENTTPAASPASGTPPARLVLTPLRPGVPDTGDALEVLVRVQAPPPPPSAPGDGPAPRMALRLALVVDRSGSMDGRPLMEALRCADHVLQRLQPQDEAAVVLYDDTVQLPVPLQSGAHSTAMRAALAGIESGGSTALHDGWLAGVLQLGSGRPGAISRVLLLSDGQANHGLCDTAAIRAHCALWLDQGIATTTVGLGRHFNEELMVAMAQAGGGGHYYGQTAEDLYDSFDEELSLLSALCLRRLGVRLAPAPGVQVQALGLVTADAAGTLPLPSLAWGSEAWLMLRLQVPAQAAGGMAALLTVTAEGMDADEATVSLSTPPLALPVLPAADCAALPVDAAVAARLGEVQFAESALEVRLLVQAGELRRAREHIDRMSEQHAGEEWVSGKLKRLRALLERDERLAAKEMLYASRRASSRLAGVEEARYTGDEMDAIHIPAFLRRKAEEGRGRKG